MSGIGSGMLCSLHAPLMIWRTTTVVQIILNMNNYLRSTWFWFINNSCYITHLETKPLCLRNLVTYILPVFHNSFTDLNFATLRFTLVNKHSYIHTCICWGNKYFFSLALCLMIWVIGQMKHIILPKSISNKWMWIKDIHTPISTHRVFLSNRVRENVLR